MVGTFLIDESPVTNARFRDSVAGTGCVTVAGRLVTADDYPDADPSLLTLGSLVFRQASGPVDLRDVRNWWSYRRQVPTSRSPPGWPVTRPPT